MSTVLQVKKKINHYVMDYGYVHCATCEENSSSPLQRVQNVLYVHCATRKENSSIPLQRVQNVLYVHSATSEEKMYHYVMDHSYVRCAIAKRQTFAMTQIHH